MRRSSLFWGIVITLAGVVLLLNSIGILRGNVWIYFWPALLIFGGLWLLLAPRMYPRSTERQDLSLPLDGASRANVTIKHGAGRLTLRALDQPGQLVSGAFYGGIEHDLYRSGDEARLTLRSPMPVMVPPMMGGQGYSWDFGLTRELPMSLTFETGAGEYNVDLSQLKVNDLVIHTGASSMNVTLPSAGVVRVKVESGAASVRLRLPDGVAGRIHVESGLSGINIDSGRFPQNGSTYETPGFDSQPNRIEIDVKTGVGSIEVR